MKRTQLLLLFAAACFAVPTVADAQAWSGILDPSRAIDWTQAGFTIPSYTVACVSQPSLLTGSGNASANTTSIQNSIASCDSTHNVVNLPAGTYYVAGIYFQAQNNVVMRGAGPNSTYLYLTTGSSSCSLAGGCSIAIQPTSAQYMQSANFLPGQNGVCSLTGVSATSTITSGTYTKGGTYIGMASCGAGTTTPSVGTILTLDQADDTTDTGGVFSCSTYDTSVNCTNKGNSSGGNPTGRVISGTQYSLEQWVTVKSIVSGSGTGPYVIQISDPFFHTNFRSSQTPGVFWSMYGTASTGNVGIESVTLDYSLNTSNNTGIGIQWCNGCWVKNIRSIEGGTTNHVYLVSSLHSVIRDSYFFGAQHGGSSSYAIELANVSASLIENNIIQQTTGPIVGDGLTGNVYGYNFTPDITFVSELQGIYLSHNSGTDFQLVEGNSTSQFLADDVWGTSFLSTAFRNQATGWQPAKTYQTYSFEFSSYARVMNVIGNVLGTPGYHTQYQVYATSPTTNAYTLTPGGTPTAGNGDVNHTIYDLGNTDTGGTGNCGTQPYCDPVVAATLMRWGNYDTVQGAITWNSAESSPAAVAYVNAQSTLSSHTLPSSFYLSGRPAWFRSVAFPPYGPDVSSGTTGICSGGTYANVPATNSSQCTGGTLTTSAWAGHANANPAQDCFLNVMNGPPDGSGSVLAFDGNACYYAISASTPGAPSNLSAVVAVN